MGDFKITTIEIEELKKRDVSSLSISYKRDGTLLYWINGDLISPRKVIRNDRFSHIFNILNKNNFPNCYGEMYLDIKGGNVFDVSSRENWCKVKFMPIDLLNNKKNYSERQKIILEKINKLNSKWITPLMIFHNLNYAWDYVLKNKGEGLVLKNDREWLKVKLLFEDKVEIISHEPSKEKGTFVLKNGSRVSGTSADFVRQFKEIKSKGLIPVVEIEYCFLTKEGKYFQPRLRRIFIKEMGKTIDLNTTEVS